MSLLRRLPLFILIFAMSKIAYAAQQGVEVDFRCLTGGHNDQIHLEWRTFSDTSSKWIGAYVRYQKSKVPITLVFKSSEATMQPEGRPWEFTSHWLEVVDGRISGEYVVVSQGANIYGFSYLNFRNQKKTEFEQDISALQDNRCEWN